jgi:FlaA1/EpsC-like NDP-sugar epimerase
MLIIRRITVIGYDIVAIPLAWMAAYWVRSNLTPLSPSLLHEALTVLPLVLLLQAFSFFYFGLYRGEWRFASIPDMVRICKSVILGALAILVVLYFSSFYIYPFSVMPPRSILPLYILILTALLGGARLFIRWKKDFQLPAQFKENVLIIGAGLAGESLIRELFRDHKKRYYPRMLLDDDPKKQGSEILGVRVVGKIKDLPKLTEQYGIHQILISIPSANAKTMQSIVDLCNLVKVPYRTLPGLSDLASGKVSLRDLRDVSLEDLLGREPIDFENLELAHFFVGKKILVTGGGGSIGSELCRQIARFSPKELVIFDHSEYNLYEIDLFLRDRFPGIPLVLYLQNITEKKEVDRLIALHKPDIIFHAAAYKHVPMLENQVVAASKNNILGTQVIAEAAIENHVKKFILISTDKAVNPSNIMGATKRVAEIFCQNANRKSDTRFITVRFGNVLGSAGSVVPLFQKQLAAGGPLTVTHPDITRYFMTIPEASQLILQASILGTGGEIFVLDMGQPIKITFLAEQLIKLSGKKINEDISIIYTGLREGEKLYEELFHKNESLERTTYDKIFRAEAREFSWDMVMECINRLQKSCLTPNPSEVEAILSSLVPEATFHENFSTHECVNSTHTESQ